MKSRDSKADGLSPFERMMELARRIVAVPKAEIDRKEAEYKRRREKEKGIAPPRGRR
jgi:uncharacterized small protein (DUF1192 family)